MDKFWSWFGRADNFIGVFTALAAGYTAYRAWQQNRRLRELARQTPKVENFAQLVELHAGVKSSAPVAFALSLVPTGDSIRAQVETFLQSQGWKMPIEELNMDGLNNDADREDFINRLREKRRYFVAQNFTEVHLFIAGPVQAGTIIGALFRNWIPVKLYHKPSPAPPQVYEYWMPLL
ncbi:MAG: hypothetical protein ABI977_31710 [Acidobacteriota bacterium]